MKLLLNKRVSKVVLNDCNPAVYSVWDAIVHHPEKLCEFVATVPLTVTEWKRQQTVYKTAKTPSLQLGCATFFLNRTCRSGILDGGVMGGLEQLGKYKINDRFNRINLIKKIQAIAQQADRIELYNLDVFEFFKQLHEPSSLLFLDPPYCEKGPILYSRNFCAKQHQRLASYLIQNTGNWLLTYDDHPMIRQLYQPTQTWAITIHPISIGYSSTISRNQATELLIASPNTKIPVKTTNS